jgi:DNA ligase 1
VVIIIEMFGACSEMASQSLLPVPFRERRRLLRSLFPSITPSDPTVARFDHVCSVEGRTDDLEPLKAFMTDAIRNRCEGVMVKVLDHDFEGLRRDEADVVDVSSDLELVGEDNAAAVDDAAAESRVGGKGRRKALLASYECDKRADSWLKWSVPFSSSLDYVG